MNEDTFDIREVLANRKYPTASVKIWMDEEVWFEMDALSKKLAVESKNTKSLETQMKALEKRRDEEAFTIHLRAISNRANEDIISKALSEYPIIRDVYGRESVERGRERDKLIQEISFAERITKLVDPRGRVQEFNDDNRRDLTRAFLDNAPVFSIEIVDQAIGALANKFEEQRALAQSPDFS